VGKALEAYMRRIAGGPSAADRDLAETLGLHRSYVGSDGHYGETLTPRQERGLVVFATSGCLDCHSGPQLSDGDFHVLGVPSTGEAIDRGRDENAIAILANNPFNASGAFFDGEPEPVQGIAVEGGFRTPSLRNLLRSAPYGHNGAFSTLEEVVDFHLQGGGTDPSTFAGEIDPLLVPRVLSADDRGALVDFLKALQGDYPPLPWGQWPSGNG
jgi:cytochrome c peroxidase